MTEQANDALEGAQAEIRRRNVAACIRVARDLSDFSVAQISAMTGLSRPTVESVVAEQVEAGLFIDSIVPRSTGKNGGRPARRYAFHARSRFVVGVDASPGTITVILADIGGTIIDQRAVVIPESIGGPERLTAIVDAVDAVLVAHDVLRRSVVTVVIAVPGVVDRNGRVLVSTRVPAWNGIDIAQHARKSLGIPVFAENDVNLAAIAEHRMGAARLADDMLFVMGRRRELSPRINAGIIINGALHRGQHSLAGEVAELGEPLSASAMKDGVDIGDAIAERVADSIVHIALAIDPDVVVIGGIRPPVADAAMAALTERIRDLTPFPVLPSIVASQLGDDVVALGALVRALQVTSIELYQASDMPTPDITLLPTDTPPAL